MDTKATPTRDELLRQLRRVVEAAPDELFDMSAYTWRKTCGTAHCAAGWAAVDPWFRANTAIGNLFREDGMAREYGIADDGLARIFDIEEGDAWYLFFDADQDVAKAEVIENIDRLLAGEPAKPYDDDDGEDWDDDDEDWAEDD